MILVMKLLALWRRGTKMFFKTLKMNTQYKI